MKETRNYRVNHNPRQKQYYGVNRYTKKSKGMKKMNTIRNVFRYLFQPIQVEARFPLIVWVLLLIATFIGRVEIVCQ